MFANISYKGENVGQKQNLEISLQKLFFVNKIKASAMTKMLICVPSTFV